ncbi:MAG: NMD3-related protein [Promethearchaeota archaeon]
MTKKYERFCINCGKTGFSKEELLEGLCFNCYKLKNPFILLKKQPILHLCKYCFSIKTKKGWIKTDALDFYEKANNFLNDDVKLNFKIAPGLITDIKLDDSSDIQDLVQTNTINFEINYKGIVHDIFEVNESQIHPIKIKFDMCESCKGFRAKISRSKIRIIAKNRNITELETEEIIKLFKNSANIYKDPNLYILSPILSKKELIFRVSSIDFARNIADQLKSIFGAVVRESVKFQNRGKSKTKKQDLNILIRLLPFFIGDVIRYNNNLLYVASIQENNINCFDFKDKVMKKFKPKQLINGERYVAKSKLEKFIITAIYKDVIQIMDLKTFQTFEIEIKNQPYLINISEGTEINGFREGENLYIIPFIIQGSDAKNE